MEMVDKKYLSLTPNWWAGIGCGSNLERIILNGVPTINDYPEEFTEEKTTMGLKTLQADAKDLFLCKNGEILFRVEG